MKRAMYGLPVREVKSGPVILELPDGFRADRLVLASDTPATPVAAYDASGVRVSLRHDGGQSWTFDPQAAPVRKVVCEVLGAGLIRGGAFGDEAEPSEPKRARRLRRTRKAFEWIWRVVQLGVDVARMRRK